MRVLEPGEVYSEPVGIYLYPRTHTSTIFQLAEAAAREILEEQVAETITYDKIKSTYNVGKLQNRPAKLWRISHCPVNHSEYLANG